MNIDMTEGMKAVADICDTIIKKVDRAYIAQCGRTREMPHRLWRMWADTGLLAIGLPEEYGGVGGQMIEVVLAHDLLHQAGLVMPATATNFMARASLLRHGSPEQKQKYLPATATGEIFFSAGITEADSGTNLFKIKTTAKRQADGSYILNGQKVYQTSFDDAQYAMVVCRTEQAEYEGRYKGLTLLIVDTKSAGVSSTVMDINMFLPDQQYVVNFDDVVVPAENLLGPEGGAISVLFDWLNPERLIGSANALGMADHVLSRAAEYAKMRAPFKVPIGTYQAIQLPIAKAKVMTEAARGMTYRAAERFDQGRDVGMETNMVKYISSQAFLDATDIAMTTFGGACMDLSQDIMPFYLQAKLQEVAPVNNNIVLCQIAEKTYGLPKSY